MLLMFFLESTHPPTGDPLAKSLLVGSLTSNTGASGSRDTIICGPSLSRQFKNVKITNKIIKTAFQINIVNIIASPYKIAIFF